MGMAETSRGRGWLRRVEERMAETSGGSVLEVVGGIWAGNGQECARGSECERMGEETNESYGPRMAVRGKK